MFWSGRLHATVSTTRTLKIRPVDPQDGWPLRVVRGNPEAGWRTQVARLLTGKEEGGGLVRRADRFNRWPIQLSPSIGDAKRTYRA